MNDQVGSDAVDSGDPDPTKLGKRVVSLPAGALDRFSGAIAIPTESIEGGGNDEVLSRFQHYLRESYPSVFSSLDVEILSPRGMILSLRGSDSSLPPVLLLAHYDVVPADGAGWTHPPYGAVVADGYLWGRGTIDSKNTVIGILEALNTLVTQGTQPRQTVYVALHGDEELAGLEGARVSARWFEERGIEFDWLLDEGSVISKGMLPGVDRPIALIGTAEKGYVDISLAASIESGHAAFPSPVSATSVLSRACRRIARNTTRYRLTDTVAGFFRAVAPHMHGLTRALLARPRIFVPLMRPILTRRPTINALLRTTRALTILKAGEKENVVPNRAEAIYNLRVLPGETVASAHQNMISTIDDPRVEVKRFRPEGAREPSRESSTESAGYHAVERAIARCLPEAVVAPFLAIVNTDSVHFKNLARDVYRFVPMILDDEEVSRIHGVDERISLKNFALAIRFFTELLNDL